MADGAPGQVSAVALTNRSDGSPQMSRRFSLGVGPMSRTYLHIGCGTKRFDGFVNIDLEGEAADLRIDVTKGLPFADNSVQGIFSEHFFEHISQAQGCAFLRECRRVLAPGGIVRIAMPDLDYCVDRYTHDWRDQAGLNDFSLNWIQNRCEFLNVAMREWGHQWIYNEEELKRVAGYAGLTFVARRELGESADPMLRSREYRKDSKLICEFTKQRVLADESKDLVSIVMAVYKPAHLRPALDSALAQTYPHCEIVIGDDCPTLAIAEIVAEYQAKNPRFPISYTRNPQALVGHNFVQCFERSRGTYIKFLNDDDTLHPTCIERMVNMLASYPDVMMVTSHRQPIDSDGNALPELITTRRIVSEDSIIDGPSTCDAIFKVNRNFLGEPTTAMYRKRDLEDVKPNILGFCDREVDGNNDVSWWLNLLGKGNGVYLFDSLSTIRQHEGQIVYMPGIKTRLEKSWEQMRFDGRRFGLYWPGTPASLFIRPVSEEPTREEIALRQLPLAHHPVSSEILISIIIPLFNQADFTRKCLDKLLLNTPADLNAEIIFVDNGSTDETTSLLLEYARRDSRIRVVTHETNLGFSRACNAGADISRGKFLLFLNNDTEVTPGWLDPLLQTLELNPQAAAVGSRLLFPDGTLQNAGIFLIDYPKSGFTLGAIDAYKAQPGNIFNIEQRRRYLALTGACVMIRAEQFREVDGFDEGYWNGYEDVDLGLKLASRGWELLFEPASVVVHHTSKSGPERFAKAKENAERLDLKWAGKVSPDLFVSDDDVIETLRQVVSDVTPPNNVPSAIPLPAKACDLTVCLLPSPGQNNLSVWLDLADLFRGIGGKHGFSVDVTINAQRSGGKNLLVADLQSLPANQVMEDAIGYDLTTGSAGLVADANLVTRFQEIWVANESRAEFWLRMGAKDVRFVPLTGDDCLRTIRRQQQDIDLLVLSAEPANWQGILEALGPEIRTEFMPTVVADSARKIFLGRAKVIYFDSRSNIALDQAVELLLYASNQLCVLASGQSAFSEVPGVECITKETFSTRVKALIADSADRYRRGKELNRWIRRPGLADALAELAGVAIAQPV